LFAIPLARQEERAMIVEWNAHMFSQDQDRYPFHPHATYIPDPSRLAADPLAAYRERLRQEGIDRAVLVQPEPYGDDHRLVLDCLEREPTRLRATCLFFPTDPEAPRKLAALRRREPRIVAVRLHAHRGKEQYLAGFADPGVRALWRQAAELGLIVELHIGPNYAAQVADAVRAYPDVTVLVDHLAEPATGDAAEYDAVLALARFARVYMKLSGLNHFASAAPLYLDARPLTRRVVDAFGPDRLVWGGGTPRIVDAHLEHLPEAERAKVKGGNLAALLGFASDAPQARAETGRRQA
jgi:predicted TIM-barrel fold metal-dependent hydrolase